MLFFRCLSYIFPILLFISINGCHCSRLCCCSRCCYCRGCRTVLLLFFLSIFSMPFGISPFSLVPLFFLLSFRFCFSYFSFSILLWMCLFLCICFASCSDAVVAVVDGIQAPKMANGKYQHHSHFHTHKTRKTNDEILKNGDIKMGEKE